MLGKLLKYELKSSAKSFGCIYVGLIMATILSVILEQFNYFEIEILEMVITILLGSLFVVVLVVTCICIYNRFKQSFFTDEGYLILTLPVKLSRLITSKIVASIIWGMFSMIISGIALYIITCSDNDIGIIKGITSVPDIFVNIWRSIEQEAEINTVLCLIINIISSLSLMIFIILMLFDMAQESYACKTSKNKSIYYLKRSIEVIVSVTVFFTVTPWIVDTTDKLNIANEFSELIIMIFMCIWGAGIYAKIHYKIDNKLNI